MLHQSFDVGGNRFRLVSNNALILKRITRSLKPFLSPKAKSPVDLYVFCADGGYLPVTIPVSARRVRSGDNAAVYLYKQFWLIDFQGMARIAVDRENGTALGFVQTRCLAEEPSLLEALLQPVYDYLRKKGLYMLHSGAVALGGKGLLLAGETQSGKTTSALRLVGGGFDFLSDDRCFLRKSGARFEALSFPEPVRVYPANVADLPEFQFLKKDRQKIPKKVFDIKQVYPHSIIDKAELKAIAFPCWDAAGESRLEMVSPGQALKEMLPLTMTSLFPDTARVHFEFIADLVEKMPCFRFYLGSDKEKWHDIAKGLLQ